MNKLAALVGPRVAELLVLGQPTDATSGTMKKATKLAKDMVINQAFPFAKDFFLHVQTEIEAPKDRELLNQINFVIDQAYGIASKWLIDEQPFFRAVTKRLTEVTVLNRHDLDLLYDQHWKSETLDQPKPPLHESDRALQNFLSDPDMTLALPNPTRAIGFSGSR